MNLKLFFFWVCIFVLSLMGLVRAQELSGEYVLNPDGQLVLDKKLHTSQTLTGDMTIGPSIVIDNQGLSHLHTSQFIVNTIAEGKAWCDGFQTAVAQSIKNRDYFMKMTKDFPFETHDEAIKRIYASDWSAQHKNGNIVQQTISIERDAVDLYVVLPQTDLMISTKEGDVKCPAKNWK